MELILVVDSDDIKRNQLVNALSLNGHSVLGAENGEVGIKFFFQHRPALVVSEILMPERDGIELIMAIRESSFFVPIISYTSGVCAEVNLEFAKGLGANRIMLGDFSINDFLRYVRIELSAFCDVNEVYA